jgi:hypothetical protein
VKLGTSFVGCGGMTGPKQPKQKGKSFTTYIEGREGEETNGGSGDVGRRDWPIIFTWPTLKSAQFSNFTHRGELGCVKLEGRYIRKEYRSRRRRIHSFQWDEHEHRQTKMMMMSFGTVKLLMF